MLCAQCAHLCCLDRASAQTYGEARVATAIPHATAKPKFQLILFWKDSSPATQAMAEQLKSAVSSRSDRLELTSVNVSDPANKSIVDRYHVGRAPMPIAVCVAPNGVVTGALRQISDKSVEHVMVTPAMADVAKALQEQKIVLTHIQSSPDSPIPACASEMLADPLYSERIVVINVVSKDPREQRFFTDMKLDPNGVAGSSLVVFAPPGVLVGQFPANASKEQIATALHAAGKCCTDPNCKHNQ